jgi:hypothetical protein
MRTDPDDLRGHASHLDGLAFSLDGLAFSLDDHGRRLAPDAYGPLCAVVPILLASVSEPLTSAIGAAAAAVADNADTIRRAADGYQQTDDDAADRLLGGGSR